MAIRKELVEAMVEEISLQRNYLEGETINSIYFGGGTPSILTSDEVAFILESIRRSQPVSADAEVTLEANPDDLMPEKLIALKSAGINRLSIGIQSFEDDVLKYFNRSHTSETATRSIVCAKDAGFTNISVDLIYAIPGLTRERWKSTLEKTIALDPQHISAYSLTIEEKTAFGNWVSKGKLIPVDEETAAEQVDLLVSILADSGYRQYEISNFSHPGFESRHNQGYWRGDKYLGVGPSAHSYNRISRQHNVANNHLYVRAIRQGRVPAEEEVLKREQQINEYILTTLRTSAGCDLDVLKHDYGYDVRALHGAYLGELKKQNLVALDEHRLLLTESGKLLADKISSDLFLIE